MVQRFPKTAILKKVLDCMDDFRGNNMLVSFEKQLDIQSGPGLLSDFTQKIVDLMALAEGTSQSILFSLG